MVIVIRKNRPNARVSAERNPAIYYPNKKLVFFVALALDGHLREFTASA
jgi:hypothetical protein